MAGVEFEQTDLPPFVDAANAARVGLQDDKLIDNALLPVSLIKHDLAHCCEKGGRSIARVFVVAAIVDGIYQWLVLRWI